MDKADKEAIRDILVSVLNTPIPQIPAVGSIYDILQSLDRVLPAEGRLVVTRTMEPHTGAARVQFTIEHVSLPIDDVSGSIGDS